MLDHAGTGSVLDRALEVWSHRKGLVVVVFALVFTAMASIATFLPNIYRSVAIVLGERHQVPESFVRSSITGELETWLQTISREILSRARLEDLITRFRLYPGLRERQPMEAIVENMRRDLGLELKGFEAMSGRNAPVAFNLSYEAWVLRSTRQSASMSDPRPGGRRRER